MAKRRVLVIYGGQSTEHEVSCRSAAYVLKNLDRSKYEVEALAISKSGQWLPQQVPKLLESDPQVIPIQSLDAIPESKALSNSETVVFPILHGTGGEDGSIQGMFDLAGVPYIGADTVGSAITIDKVVAKQLVAAAGVSVVPWCDIRYHGWVRASDEFLDQCIEKLGFPMFVKPAKLGSSVGVTKVKESKEDLRAACEAAFAVDDRLLVEAAIDARELECAALGDYDPEVSVVGEIRMANAEFYDYDAKYTSEDGADLIIPADITEDQSKEVREMAKAAFVALNLYGMARLDMFMDKKTTKLYFNEANTIPGFTSISQYPMLWKASGVDASALLDRLIDLAVQRSESRRKLERSR